MTRVLLEAEKITTPSDFYRELRAQLKLPAHFGDNLDALWDFLTTELAGAAEITWRGFSRYPKLQKKDLQGIADLLGEVAAGRSDFRFIVT